MKDLKKILQDLKIKLQELNRNKDLSTKNVIKRMVNALNTNNLHLKLPGINERFTLKVINLDEKTATFEHCTLLHVAAAFNCEKIAKLLIDNGAYVGSIDLFKRTPLHYAAMYDSKEVAEVLIEKEANVDTLDCFEETSLQYALRNNDHLKTAKLLIGNDADQSCIIHIHHSRAIKAGVIVGVLDAIVIPSVLPFTTKLPVFAVTAATIVSTLIASGLAYGLAYTWSKYELSSKLDKVSYDASSSQQPTNG